MKSPFAASLLALAFASVSPAAIVVFEDNFNVSQGSGWTTSGQIGTSDWSVARSGDDWGARIHNNQLELTNTASAAANVNGWAYSSVNIGNSYDSLYNTTLGQNQDLVTWSFNMRQIRTNPSGFDAVNTYGVAYVLASNTSGDVRTSGSGYAVVLGNSGTPNNLRLVFFNDGLNSVPNNATTGIVTGRPAGLDDIGNQYLSIQVTYNPATNQWSLYGRNDGGSFQDPLSGSLGLIGQNTNSTHVNTALNFSGAFWQGSTAANQTAFFDNVTVSVIPEPSTGLLFLLGVTGLLGLLRRRSRV